MKSKLLMFAVMFSIVLIGISFVMAQEVPTFKKDQNSTLFQICDDCTYVYLDSIQLPTKQMIFINQSMFKNQNSFEYYYTFSSIGDGNYNVCGDKGGVHKCEAIPYNVTGSGITDTIGFYIIILILTLGLVILGYSIQDVWVIILGAFGLVLFGLYILFYGIVGMEDNVYTWGIGIITLMLGAYFMTRASLEQIQYL